MREANRSYPLIKLIERLTGFRVVCTYNSITDGHKRVSRPAFVLGKAMVGVVSTYS